MAEAKPPKKKRGRPKKTAQDLKAAPSAATITTTQADAAEPSTAGDTPTDAPAPAAVKSTPQRGRGPGRPPGATNSAATVRADPSRCPRCDSTQRTGYVSTTTRAIRGKLGDGRIYTHVIWRRCRCKKCGQIRVDKSFENRN